MRICHKGSYLIALLIISAKVFILPLNKCYATGKPNIVFIIIGTLRPDHLGCYGYKKKTSSNIDNVAAEGVLFTEAISQIPISTASIASIMTGKYPHAHGVLDLSAFGYSLKSNETTLAEILKLNGYATAAFISTTFLKVDSGLNQGFEHYDDKVSTWRRSDKETLDRTINWLKEERAAPFFLFIHLYSVHDYGASPEHENSSILQYDNNIQSTDLQIKRFLKTLDKLGLSKNTLIIITADHGETLWEHFCRFEHGAFVYEEEIRIPLIMKYSALKAKARKIDNPVAAIDIMPTILDILRIKPPKGIDGVSFLPIILGETGAKRGYIFSESHIWGAHNPGVEDEIYLGIDRDRVPFCMFDKIRCIRDDTYKLISVPTEDGIRYELYNLKKDPEELNNLIYQEPETAQRLTKFLSLWMDSAKYKIADTSADFGCKIDQETREKLRSLGYVK